MGSKTKSLSSEYLNMSEVKFLFSNNYSLVIIWVSIGVFFLFISNDLLKIKSLGESNINKINSFEVEKKHVSTRYFCVCICTQTVLHRRWKDTTYTTNWM